VSRPAQFCLGRASFSCGIEYIACRNSIGSNGRVYSVYVVKWRRKWVVACGCGDSVRKFIMSTPATVLAGWVVWQVEWCRYRDSSSDDRLPLSGRERDVSASGMHR
jgi:hypothetical protein